MSEPDQTPQQIRIEGIECWRCAQSFGFLTTLNKDHAISVYCGVCDAENVIDLQPYRQSETSFKSSTSHNRQASAQSAAGYALPASIPGRKPPEQKTEA